MVEQGLQVCFNPLGCYVEDFQDDCILITKGNCVGRMFTLDVDVPEIKSAMFAQGAGVVVDIEIWHKRIGHVNVQRLKSMQNQNIATSIPKFKVDGIPGVCEACQLGKQSKSAFPHDKHVSKNVLDVVHSDVWGPTKTTCMGG